MLQYQQLKTYLTLKDYHGKHTELISLYIPAEKPIIDVITKLKQEITESENIKSKENRKKVLDNITSIINSLRTIEMSITGYAIFCCDCTVHIIELPAVNKTFLYRCDSYFYLEILEENITLVENNVGLVVLDSHDATIAVLQGLKLTILSQIESFIPRKNS